MATARRAAPLAAVVLAAALLAGCAGRKNVQRSYEEPHMPYYYDPTPEDPTAPAAQASQGGGYGSAGLISFPTVLVSVYLDEADGRAWDEQGIARSRSNLAVAVDWITGQCAGYGAEARIIYDDGTDPDLCVRREYRGTFAGGEDSDEADDLFDAADLLCEQLDTDALRQKYGTSSIGFLYFLPLEGCSFTMVHYLEDGDDFYYEYSFLYEYDAFSDPGTFDSPAVYAHEILHQYGAPDLYEESQDYFVTPELVEYVAETWPTAIMQDTYNAQGGIDYDHIDRTLCPVTACRLGLCTEFEGMERFPAVTETPPGVFTEGREQGGNWQNIDGAVAARAAA